ncbi:hypothetical protein Acor_67370 [Acrocarpospora corrugata]|uniref:Uncharacterized protein n=1 Tax=Acrocarpospora corrugata TaxID=35763 RepID=A0A5M3W8L0_9ACTN|nr:hypothetical protein Acor_67370 [Acrocarpospora corrugata]
MTKDLNTLATALYVKVDDLLKACPGLAPVAAEDRDRADTQRCRTGDLGGHVDVAGFRLRTALAALCPRRTDRDVPVSAWPIGVRQAAAEGIGAGGGRDPDAGRRYLAVER